MSKYAGSCLCGGVTFEVNGEVRDVIACHCLQCRKTTGNYMSATACNEADLNLTSDETLAWYDSTDEASRGFCNRCGASLFWKRHGSGKVSICAGTIDGDLGKPLAGHIYCDFAGDYYEISGGDYQKSES